MPLRRGEQRLGRGVVQIDGMGVLHVELHQAERGVRAGLLHDLAVHDGHPLRCHVGLALRQDFLLRDPLRHHPRRVHDQLIEGADQHRRLAIGIRRTSHDAAGPGGRAVVQIDEFSCSDIDVDAGVGNVARQPAPPFEIDRQLLGAHRHAVVHHLQRRLVRLARHRQLGGLLHDAQRGDQRRVEGRVLHLGVGRQITGALQPGRHSIHARASVAGLQRRAASDRVGGEVAVREIGVRERSVLVVLRRQPLDPAFDIVALQRLCQARDDIHRRPLDRVDLEQLARIDRAPGQGVGVVERREGQLGVSLGGAAGLPDQAGEAGAIEAVARRVLQGVEQRGSVALRPRRPPLPRLVELAHRRVVGRRLEGGGGDGRRSISKARGHTVAPAGEDQHAEHGGERGQALRRQGAMGGRRGELERRTHAEGRLAPRLGFPGGLYRPENTS